jgi:hypothetical protein
MRRNAQQYGWSDVGRAVLRVLAAAVSDRQSWVWRLKLRDVYGSLLDEAIRRAELEQRPSIDILIPLGPGSKKDNVELRYALRSIERHVTGYRRIVVVGAIPAWLRETDRVLPVQWNEASGPKAYRIAAKVSRVFDTLDVTDRLAFWNDDFVTLRGYDIRTLPPYYTGVLARAKTNGYRALLDRTGKALSAANLPQRNYDLHTPILYDRERFLGLTAWWERSRHCGGLVVKSVYGNHYYHETGVVTSDSKLQANWVDRIDVLAARRWVLSYGDAALQHGFGEWLRAHYPDPSPAESTVAAAKRQAGVCARC